MAEKMKSDILYTQAIVIFSEIIRNGRYSMLVNNENRPALEKLLRQYNIWYNSYQQQFENYINSLVIFEGEK